MRFHEWPETHTLTPDQARRYQGYADEIETTLIHLKGQLSGEVINVNGQRVTRLNYEDWAPTVRTLQDQHKQIRNALWMLRMRCLGGHDYDMAWIAAFPVPTAILCQECEGRIFGRLEELGFEPAGESTSSGREPEDREDDSDDRT